MLVTMALIQMDLTRVSRSHLIYMLETNRNMAERKIVVVELLRRETVILRSINMRMDVRRAKLQSSNHYNKPHVSVYCVTVSSGNTSNSLVHLPSLKFMVIIRVTCIGERARDVITANVIHELIPNDTRMSSLKTTSTHIMHIKQELKSRPLGDPYFMDHMELTEDCITLFAENFDDVEITLSNNKIILSHLYESLYMGRPSECYSDQGFVMHDSINIDTTSTQYLNYMDPSQRSWST